MYYSMSSRSSNPAHLFNLFSESSDHVVSLFIVGKPAILVVMHHTYNPHHVVAKSQSQVNNSNVHLTVDCLFYEDHLLDCDLNNIMWNDIRRTFRSPNRQVRISLTGLLLGIHAITDVCGLVFSIKVLQLIFFLSFFQTLSLQSFQNCMCDSYVHSPFLISLYFQKKDCFRAKVHLCAIWKKIT